ncbi:MAG: ABC transporter ATP-binding protein [Anaerolineae bacterium]|nr:ABC transporter ATP-binding protein [Anaerolineales bacterium]MCQ3979386.1 ABC transporter ATP-binding protein [Anaerolineae bacterium]
MAVVLETQAVSKIYKSDHTTVKAVDEVSLTVQSGEFIALVGPSGSGKTTMLAMLAALLNPSSGAIIIDGHNLAEMKESERTRFRREKIGFTFQQNNLLPFLSARENVELMLRLNNSFQKQGRERARELLTRLGLGDRLDNLPSQLSGGQQQRVAIARALIHNPNLVLADEPTANLDTERAFQVVETFAELIHEHNRAGIMVTHDLRMCHYVDKVVQMLDGRIERIIEDKAEIEALAGARLGPNLNLETPVIPVKEKSKPGKGWENGRLIQPANPSPFSIV